MSQFTKKAIMETTLRLAEKKPLNKITVRDIVEECGITRNTFYYHYHDVYEVLEDAVFSQVEELRRQNGGDHEKTMFDLVGQVFAYRKLWVNLYRSLGREKLAFHVEKQLHGVICDYLDAKTEQSPLAEEEREIISAFYEEALFGVLVRWILDDRRNFTPEEFAQIAGKIRILFEGQLELLLQNCRKLHGG